MNTSIEILKKYAKELQIEIKDETLQKFEIYLKDLIDYNSHTNLTSITEPSLIVIKHFLDCLTVSKAVKICPRDRIIDIGSGAGFPGVPIKIQFPQIDITLVDSREKRIKFLNELVKNLKLEAQIIYNRAESAGKDKKHREHFNIAVSRAVASLNILCEYCIPFVTIGGVFVAMKGPNIEDELKNAKESINRLGGAIEKVEKIELPAGNGKRSILIIRKIKNTPEEYPRASAKIAKNPL